MHARHYTYLYLVHPLLLEAPAVLSRTQKDTMYHLVSFVYACACCARGFDFAYHRRAMLVNVTSPQKVASFEKHDQSFDYDPDGASSPFRCGWCAIRRFARARGILIVTASY